MPLGNPDGLLQPVLSMKRLFAEEESTLTI